MKAMRWSLVLMIVAGAAGVWAADGWLSGWWKKPAPVVQPAAVVAPAAPAAATPAGMVNLGALATKGAALQIGPHDRIQGSMTAPITVIEYASLTCSHCADFAKETIPQFRKEWVETGKAKYVLRDLAWDNLALGMAKIARCAPQEQFYALVDAFFAGQQNIVMSKDPLVEVKKITRLAGMTDDQVDACVKDAELHKQVVASKDTAMQVLGVKGTPAVFINGAEVDGAVDYGVLKAALDKAAAGK